MGRKAFQAEGKNLLVPKAGADPKGHCGPWEVGFFLACCSVIGNYMLYKISVLLVGLKEGWERVKLVSGRPVSDVFIHVYLTHTFPSSY